MTEKYKRAVSSIILVQLPKKLTYFAGTKAIDPKGGQICAIYSDGSYETVPMNDPDVHITFDGTVEGQKIATLTYMGKELLFPVLVRKPAIRKFIAVKNPLKKEYLAGELLDLAGLELSAEYETGEILPWTEIPQVNYRVKQGDAVYPLSIANITIPIFIKVKASNVTGIRVGKLPDKTEYLERRDKLSVKGGTIIQMYDSGAEDEIPMTLESVRGFSNLEPGQQTLTVQVGPHTTTFDVAIRAKKAVRISILNKPVKVQYIEGQLAEMDGLKISAEYDNGEQRITEEWIHEPKVISLNTAVIKVLVDDASAEIPISVTPRQLSGIELIKGPNKTQYLERKDLLDVEGAEIQLNYNYGESVTIPVTADMVHGYDNRQAGECPVEVQYKGFVTTFLVTVIPQQLIGIFISNMPVRTSYAPGELFSRTGLVVSGFYNNGLIHPVEGYTIVPDRPLMEGDAAVVITSMDKTAIVPIRVSEGVQAESPGQTDMGGPAEWQPSGFAASINPSISVEEDAPLYPEETSEEAPKKWSALSSWASKLLYPSSLNLRGIKDE